MNKKVVYQPIACALYDEYELAIMHKKRLFIKWQDENGTLRKARVLPDDIQIKSGAEFLLARTEDNRSVQIRLDKITLLD